VAVLPGVEAVAGVAELAKLDKTVKGHEMVVMGALGHNGQ